MNARFFLTLAAAAAIAVPAGAQGLQRRAALVGGGGPQAGRCTADVIVDGAAEVEIRGDNGSLRDLSGRPPEWRRFECTSVMPINPGNIRFSASGRGSAQLVRDPRNGGVAVIRIQDPDAGAQIYHLELSWSNGGPYQAQGAWDRDRSERDRAGFGANQAVQVCQDAVRQQAMDRFHTDNVYFRDTRMDDNPGRRDWVVGMLDAHPPYGPERHMRFSCSVNFDTGRVRSAQIEPMEGAGGEGYRPSSEMNQQAFENCRREVSERVRREGYDNLDFQSMNVDNSRQGGWITGFVRAQGQDHLERR